MNSKTPEGIKKEVIKFMYLHYTDTDSGYSRVLNQITDITTVKNEDKIFVTITTHSPGIIIGKGGRSIDELKVYLERNLKIDIQIHLIENKMWSNIF